MGTVVGNTMIAIMLLLIGLLFGNIIGRERFRSEAENWHRHYEEKFGMTIKLNEMLTECYTKKGTD